MSTTSLVICGISLLFIYLLLVSILSKNKVSGLDIHNSYSYYQDKMRQYSGHSLEEDVPLVLHGHDELKVVILLDEIEPGKKVYFIEVFSNSNRLQLGNDPEWISLEIAVFDPMVLNYERLKSLSYITFDKVWGPEVKSLIDSYNKAVKEILEKENKDESKKKKSELSQKRDAYYNAKKKGGIL